MEATQNTPRPSATGNGASNASQHKTASTTPECDPPTPSITYTSVKNVFTAIRSADGDALKVEAVMSEIFAKIVKRRSESEKFKLFFSEPRQAIIVTLPRIRHEVAAASRISIHVNRNIQQMGPEDSIKDTKARLHGAAADRQSLGPGEPDGSFTPILPNGKLKRWPSVVIEVADSESLVI